MKPTRTKIMATIGPACNDQEIIEKMIIEGLDLCRLNFSHGTHDEHLKVIQDIRELNRKLNTNVAILADLQGPKLRVGEVENNKIILIDGMLINLVSEPCISTKDQLYISYPELAKDVKIGDSILVDDGKIQLEVVETNKKDNVTAKIIHGGPLSSRKGVNFPDTKISQPSMTEKDYADAEFALDQDIDWIALSFVRSATDMLDLRDIIRRKKKSTRIIAKIEKPEALEEIDEIIEASHGIMIARGDLGVEVPLNRLPLIQKDIIQKCINQARPVVIATQMMESMIDNFRPTRAETNDVANAVLDGADCLMLSGETSVGNFPVEVVHSMIQIIRWTEENGFQYIREHAPTEFSPSFLPETLCNHASQMAEKSGASAIISFTHSGYTTSRIASHRPSANIYGFTNNKKVLNSMSILWGVHPVYIDTYNDINMAIKKSIEMLLETDEIKEDDVVLHLGSIPMNMKGRTNMVKITYIK